ncbi:MAG: isoprenylcysteine carboxylmethyltransferase family protein [Acidobacteriia bacterium]|nr:isoprenylcysteine carboxylmethyltransferase family protein [Terriglobia bacterium]
MLRTLSILGLAIMVLALAGLISTHSLFSASPAMMAVQACALVLLIWARLTFGIRSFHASAGPTKGGLVTTGPYAFIRHPIYTSVSLFGWAGILAHWSLLSIFFGLLLLAGALVRMLCEERLVAERYPEYWQYMARTKRMVPFLF